MGRRQPLPAGFEGTFSVGIARLHGISRERLKGSDLDAPFHGVRTPRDTAHSDEGAVARAADPFQRQREDRVARAALYAARLHTGHFFSHQTAASIWGAPLPLEFDEHGRVAGSDDLALHVSASGGVAFPRARGIVGHRTLASLTSIEVRDGLRVTSPDATWAALGTLPLMDLIALGDYFCRRWRPGHGRPDPDRAPLTTIGALRASIEVGRRRGARRLRTALESVREDSWSPRETHVRCVLVAAGLPEPQLNIDVFASDGRFLACVDMAYPDRRVAVEYMGMLHGERWAQDVERIAALRAAGWTVIEVTSPLLHKPGELARRVAAALGR
ncbi:hypothetical protein [Microbacterium oxydans]|uniref:hypothetical protein n=1 Tax=Microbacterium oxydans TaxID=82380 RepID=UPI0024AD13CC|nr:hypothetical protein [Microbacterium oxydans]